MTLTDLNFLFLHNFQELYKFRIYTVMSKLIWNWRWPNSFKFAEFNFVNILNREQCISDLVFLVTGWKGAILLYSLCVRHLYVLEWVTLCSVSNKAKKFYGMTLQYIRLKMCQMKCHWLLYYYYSLIPNLSWAGSTCQKWLTNGIYQWMTEKWHLSTEQGIFKIQ